MSTVEVQSIRIKRSHLENILKALELDPTVDEVVISQNPADGKVRVYREETITKLRPVRMTPKAAPRVVV